MFPTRTLGVALVLALALSIQTPQDLPTVQAAPYTHVYLGEDTPEYDQTVIDYAVAHGFTSTTDRCECVYLPTNSEFTTATGTWVVATHGIEPVPTN